MSTFISPSYMKSTLRRSSSSTASRTRCAFSRQGLPKFEKDSIATRGSWPMARATLALPTAMSASSDGVGLAWTLVSEMNTVRPRATIIVRPNGSSPGLAGRSPGRCRHS